MAEADDLQPQDLPPVRVRRRRRSAGRPIVDVTAGRWSRWAGMAVGAILLCPLAQAFPPLGVVLIVVGLVLIGRGLQTRDNIWHRTRERAPDLLIGGLLLVGSAALALFLAGPDWLPARAAPKKIETPPGEMRWWP